MGTLPRLSIHFLVDENAPYSVVEFLQSRGHNVEWVGDAFAKSSPDSLLLTAAEQWDFVVITFDKDFKRLIKQVPAGSRSKVKTLAGRISFSCSEPVALKRLEEMIERIELLFQLATLEGTRFIMQISASSITLPR